MEISFSQRIRERYPLFKTGLVSLTGLDNKAGKALRPERKSVEQLVRKHYKDFTKIQSIKWYDKYFGRFDKPFPLAEGIKAVLEGRGIPTWSPLVDAVILAELKHAAFLGMMDADKLVLPLQFDEAQEGEEFFKLGGGSVFLQQGDVVVRDAKGIVLSYLEGPAERVKIGAATKNCLVLGLFVPGIKEDLMKQALRDAARLARQACKGKASDIEFHYPREGTETTPSGPQEGVKVTPWEVSGAMEKINYDKLIKEFGTRALSPALLKRLEKHTGPLHFMLRRGVFFSHRDLDWVLKEFEKGKELFLYTGRGPSGHTHLGHLVPWVLTKWLQDKLGAELWFQMTDDEKFLFSKKGLTVEDANKFAYENALDVIALGFDPKKTFIFSDLDYAKTLYREAVKVARRLTFSTAKAVFGFTHESNVGQIFFTSMQSVPAFLPCILKKKKMPCLIPHAIDQDPHFRVSRDILPKLGYSKPAAIHNVFLPGLGRGGKMSASEPSTAVFTTDKPQDVKKKIMNSFTGGQGNVADQRKLGGNPDVCPLYQYEKYLLEPSDRVLAKIYQDCRAGKLLCGHHKKDLAGKCVKFLARHQKAREAARKKLSKFILKD
ncbi:MAG: tryptophan--tRNA ligase [Candidatus Aenigmatarchaeota archaeon]